MSFSVYTSQFDVGLLSRPPETPPEFPHRSIGRPHSEKVREGQGIRVFWPWTEHGRAKKIISRSGVRRRYVVPCFRGKDREAHCEADEEATAAVLLDACATVQFQEQPARIEFDWRGELTEHYPDLLVAHGGCAEFWECKRDHEARDLVIRRRTDRLQELLDPIGFRYRLVPRRQLYLASYYSNAIELRRHAKFIADHPEWASELSIADLAGPGISAERALRHVAEPERYSSLASLLYNNVLVTDLSRPLSLAAVVRRPSTSNGGPPWVLELFGKNS